MPQDENNQLLSMIPRRGVSVTVKIGTPVGYEDVLADYHAAAAKRAAVRAENGGKSGAKPPEHRFFMLSCACSKGLFIVASPPPLGKLVWLMICWCNWCADDNAVVPARVNPNGIAVPSYREKPLMIKPPDHDTLNPEEALIEEQFRLQVYADVTERIHAGMVGLEKAVRAHRAKDPVLAALDADMKSVNSPIAELVVSKQGRMERGLPVESE